MPLTISDNIKSSNMNYENLKLKIQSSEAGEAIAELKKGRMSAMPKIDEFENDLDPTRHKVMDETIRKDKWVRTDGSEASNDDVVVVNGSEEARPGMKRVPVERIAIAMQRLIVERAVSFAFGTPAEYDAEVADDNEQRVYDALMSVLKDVKIRSTDRKIARSMFGSTEVAECWYLVESPTKRYGFNSTFKLRMSIFSPLNGDRLYPYFDGVGDLIAFSREYTQEDANKTKHEFFETYTHEQTYRWEQKGNKWELMDGYPIEQKIGKIPIVYGRQENPEWEKVQGLIDRLEVLLSNFADTNDYHAAPKIFVTGQINGWASKGESGMVIQGDEGASMQYVSWQQAPEAVRLEIETLLKMIYTITQTPDISFDNVKGISAVSGVALKMLFMDAHLKVQAKSEIFDEYLQRRCSIILAFLAQFNSIDRGFVDACETMLVEPRLVPYMIEDETTKIANLAAATGNKSLCSQKTAIRRLGWVDDVDKELEEIGNDEGGMSMNDIMGQEPYDITKPSGEDENKGNGGLEENKPGDDGSK